MKRSLWVRLFLAWPLVGLWLGLLLMGWTAGGMVHLLLLVAVVVFPWRSLNRTVDPAAGDGG